MRPLPTPTAQTGASLFRSFFQAGFECSSHRRRGRNGPGGRPGRRLDLVAATGHATFAAADYCRCAAAGLRTVRDGVRWHLAEPSPGRFDFSAELPRLRAARDAGVQVVWDVCHYGWPDDVDPFAPAFPARLARFARAFAAVAADEGDDVPWYCPVNEISFLAWGGGDVACLNPYARRRGPELKRNLVRAAVAVIEAVREVDPRARFLHADPLIHVVPDPARPWTRGAAARYRRAQYEAWDMLAGRLAPELGGRPDYLDVVGVNFYCHNQWAHGGAMVPRGDPRYRPFREMLAEAHARYGRPLVVAETGIEGPARAEWLGYVAGEVAEARAAGAPVEGVCWYPVLDYPGWADDRHCPTGLWGYADADGGRPVDRALLAELRRQQRRAGAPPTPRQAGPR